MIKMGFYEMMKILQKEDDGKKYKNTADLEAYNLDKFINSKYTRKV